MLEKFHTHVLENVITVCDRKAELDRNRIDQTSVSPDQSLPGERVAAETKRHQFRVGMLPVIGRVHYLGFLDFQKLSSPKKIMTPDEMRTMMNRPEPVPGVC